MFFYRSNTIRQDSSLVLLLTNKRCTTLINPILNFPKFRVNMQWNHCMCIYIYIYQTWETRTEMEWTKTNLIDPNFWPFFLFIFPLKLSFLKYRTRFEVSEGDDSLAVTTEYSCNQTHVQGSCSLWH